jgi:cytochrome P450
LLFVTDPERHQFLRRLVGQSMTPEQISLAMPALIASATEQIDTLKVGEDVVMEEVLTRFTLDVAWRQILGVLVCFFFHPPVLGNVFWVS